MVSGSVKGIEEIADRDGCSPRKVNMTLSLAFLAPEIVKAAIDGRLPRGVGISRLSGLPHLGANSSDSLDSLRPSGLMLHCKNRNRITRRVGCE